MSPNELPEPPDPFEPGEAALEPGTRLFRVHTNRIAPHMPNPGFGAPSRFAFFAADHARTALDGGTPVPVLYAAETAVAAIAETVLHDVAGTPERPGHVVKQLYYGRSLSTIDVTARLRLADCTGIAAKRLGIEGTVLSAHTDYARTVRWAEAAFRAGFDGIVYMSHRCNTDRAYALFDRAEAGASSAGTGTSTGGRLARSLTPVSLFPLDPALVPSTGFDVLVDACAAAGFEVVM